MNLQFLPGLEAAIIENIPVHKIKELYLYEKISDSYKKIDINYLLDW